MILFIIFSLFLTFVLSIFTVYILTLLPPKKGRFKYGGVYSVQSSYYHVKYAITFVVLIFKKWYEKKKDVGPLILFNRAERKHLKTIEKLQSVEETDSIDSVYFYCTGNIISGNNVAKEETKSIDIILRVARRKNRINEHWMMIRTNNEPLFLNPESPKTSIGNCSPNGWTTLTGVTVHCERSNEKWSIKYNGWLKTEGSNGNQVHVNLKMSFTAFTNIFDFHKDTSTELVADAIARESWSKKFFDQLKSFKEKKQIHYEQWGGYTGTITFGREETFTFRNCKGYRDHSFGIRNWDQYQRYGTFFGYLENGSCFSLGSVCCRNTLSHIRHGYYITAYGDVRPVTHHNFDLWRYFLTSPPRSQCNIEFYAGGERFELTCKETAETEFQVNEGKTNIFERFMIFTLNDINGKGVGEYCASDAVPRDTVIPITSLNTLSRNANFDKEEHCISIKEEGSRDRNLCGGKGTHLGDLAKISKEFNEIIVPDAFVVTTRAFTTFIERNEEIKEATHNLEFDIKKSSPGELKHLCEDVQSKVNDGDIPLELERDIIKQLEINMGMGWDMEKLAVRSSSADEDSAGSSGAGQMETFLGVQGKEELMKSIKRCWSSQYSYQAVVYRSRYGQRIDCKMAVVIMKMIPSEASGVLFTVNPLDGDSTRMIINSTFGLGEALVSGKCIPDNFVVEIDINKKFSIQSKVVGNKETRMDMLNDGNGLMEREGLNVNEFSLSDKDIIKLAKICIMIQDCYGEPSDIEWAWSDGKFYVLQVRPITNLNIETDEEFIHEFDSSLSMEEECITSANIGEMMPMAVTPLTLSIFGSAVDSVMQTIPVISGINQRYLSVRRYLPSYCNHLFINLHCIMIMPIKSAFFSDIRMVCLALMGRVLEKPTKEDIQRFSGSKSFLKSIKCSVLSMTSRFQGTKKTIEWEKKLGCGYKVPLKENSGTQMEAIANQLNDYYLCWLDTVHNTSQSAIWSMILMSVLENKNGWNQEIYSQMATLLSTCSNVYSADVPSALKEIANAICQKKSRKDFFLEQDTEGCIQWLMSLSSEDVGELYVQFLKRHGHRCIREAEFRERSWRTDQTNLISSIKAMVLHLKDEDNKSKIELSVTEAIDSLHLKINPLKRFIIKWLLGKARKAVGLREWGKSLSIQMCEVFKLAFYKLGELMVKENLIPDPDLVYFFTSDELISVLVDKDEPMSKFIGRVFRRKKVLDLQMKMSIPHISYGTPVEISKGHPTVVSRISNKKLSGFPVSVGVVEAFGRVIRTVEEAAHIKPGEILVVPYTDVGWTPYFPLLAGLVTEKGGLLSHGAVVAREFGLPCIVSCEGCTSTFKTGERILLNATQGTMELSASNE